MGKDKIREMLCWTKEEYIQFSNAIIDKPVSFCLFEILYWCGLYFGETLALTSPAFNYEYLMAGLHQPYS